MKADHAQVQSSRKVPTDKGDKKGKDEESRGNGYKATVSGRWLAPPWILYVP